MEKNPKKAAFLKMVLKNSKKKDLGKKGKEEGKVHETSETKVEETVEPKDAASKKWSNLAKK